MRQSSDRGRFLRYAGCAPTDPSRELSLAPINLYKGMDEAERWTYWVLQGRTRRAARANPDAWRDWYAGHESGPEIVERRDSC